MFSKRDDYEKLQFATTPILFFTAITTSFDARLNAHTAASDVKANKFLIPPTNLSSLLLFVTLDDWLSNE